MKVLFDHIGGFGKVETTDFIYSNPRGVLQDGDFLDALEKGWIEWGDYWYNLRSVRINTNQYEPTYTTKKMGKRINASLEILSEGNIKKLQLIYDKYLSKKGFKRPIPLKSFQGMFVIVYEYQNKCIGANIFKLYEQINKVAMVSYQFIWDYEEPKLSLGNVSQYYEHKYAEMMKADYIYILGGYESTSKYKSSFKGFEWWTGESWSSDANLYNSLCDRDTQITMNGNI
jgi:arginyl-tRNA--protein-N-Asp/Glu arginylyltransferase